MKKIISTILICVVFLTCILSMTSCGKMLTGEYEADLAVAECTYKFNPFGKVELTVDPIVGEDVVYEGKYSLNDACDEITLTFEGEDSDEYSGTFAFARGEENGEKYIKIGIIKYTMED